MKPYGQRRDAVARAITSGDVHVAVYGIGKMGLPLAAVFAEAGARVTGVDIDRTPVEAVNAGRSHVDREPSLDDMIVRNVRAGRLKASTDGVAVARDADVLIVLVPTLLTTARKPDLTAVKAVAQTIAKGVQPGALVIQESTVPPGTTEGVLSKWLSTPERKAGRDFGLAFCPERTASGRAIKDITEAYPKVVGGIDAASTEAAVGLYEPLGKRSVIPVSSARTAEAVKVFEGAYRDVNIALANELARYAEQLGIDVAEAIKVANTQPYSHIHEPGIGVGGHCIPVYPYFLMGKGPMPLLKTARRVNDGMPGHAVTLLRDALKEHSRALKGARVLVLGIVYRPGVQEIRYSPAVDVVRRLQRAGARVSANDPLWSPSRLKGQKVGEGRPEDGGWDAILVATAHKEYHDVPWEAVVGKMRTPVVVDGRAALDPARISGAGATYRRIGMG